jgi:hypothetical protein
LIYMSDENILINFSFSLSCSSNVCCFEENN